MSYKPSTNAQDEYLLTIPTYQCPGCGSVLLGNSRYIEKTSRAAEKALQKPDNFFAVLTCPTVLCPQYEVIKIVRIPKIRVKATRVHLWGNID